MVIKQAIGVGVALAALVASTNPTSAQTGTLGQAVARAGAIEHIRVLGKALEGNLEGDPANPEITVYLPPSYASSPGRRYPVVYLLHGYGGTDATWTGRLAKLLESADRLAAGNGYNELIVVMPNAYSLHKGSMYSSSPTSGDWETYIARDLVAYVDGHYRTIADRMSRGIAGHSMGGYGALRIGMKRPDVFSSLYAMSACCLTPSMSPRPESMAAAEAIRTREQAVENSRAPGFGSAVILAEAAAWSPNPTNPPLYLDLPVKDGKVRPEIVAKWAANAPLAMLDQYVPSLKAYKAVAVEVGTKDSLLNSNKELDAALTRLGVVHVYEEYDGDHTNRVGQRIEMNVLPFFSKQLATTAARAVSTR